MGLIITVGNDAAQRDIWVLQSHSNDTTNIKLLTNDGTTSMQTGQWLFDTKLLSKHDMILIIG